MKYRVTIDKHNYEVEVHGEELLIRDADGVEQRVTASLKPVRNKEYRLSIDGRSQPVWLLPRDAHKRDLLLAGQATRSAIVYDELSLALAGSAKQQGALTIKSPMPGIVLDVKVQPGQEVHEGDALLILEAMKTENEICAELNGRVKSVHVSAGDTVQNDGLLIELEELEESAEE